MAPAAISCPRCGSKQIWKDGIRYVRERKVQRYLCRLCGHRFSNSKVEVNIIKQSPILPDSVHNFRDGDLVNVSVGKVGFQDSSFTIGKDVRSHSFSVVGKTLNKFLPKSRERQVRASKPEKAKNLVEVESRTEKRAAGATKPSEVEVKGKIVDHLWWLKKNGYKKSTIQLRGRLLRTLMKRRANLLDPETVKEAIAKMGCMDGTKAQYVIAYDVFAHTTGIRWNPPRYEQTEKIPFIPTEAEIDQLIAACQIKTAALLQTLKETATRVGEAWQLKWIDIDFERRIIRLNLPEKRSKARIFSVSEKLIGMLSRLPRRSEKVFGYQKLQCKRANFRTTRKRIAANLQNPRILQITFHTLRHWKATMLYHQTKDILYVKEFLGHKKIENTLKYVQLEKALFARANDEFHVKVAKNLDEACNLLEAGFEYVTDMKGCKLFRKRK